MARTVSSSTVRRTRKALTPEARENQLIAKAMNLAEKQIDEGTASSQIICHFLKAATSRAELEKEKIRHENELLRAKTESLQSAKNSEELLSKAIKAMGIYKGQGDEDEDLF